VRRHAVTLACVALLGGVLGAAYYLDPGRPLRELERAAIRGPVTLIGPSGAPAYHQFISGEEKSQIGVARDGSWVVHTRSFCFIELLPDPGRDRFRYSVQIRHDAGLAPASAAWAGIYVGRTPWPRLSQNDHLVTVLALNDIGSPATSLPNLILPHAARRAQPRRHNFVALNPKHIATLVDGRMDEFMLRGVTGAHFTPARDLGVEQPYRLLEIVVTPERMAGYWDGQATTPLTSTEYGNSVLGYQKHVRSYAPADESVDKIPLTYNARGGLGVYVNLGSVWFKNATITPLGEAD
jgi:hypothetical protein